MRIITYKVEKINFSGCNFKKGGKNMKLEEVSQVSIGILTSREVTEIGENEYKLFNLKNYDNQEEYEDVKTLKNFDDKLTRKGDLLIRLVYPNRIIYIDGEMENLLVPSQMCIIRVDPKKVDSQYLKWYLESESGKERILENITGSSIQKISVSDLRKLEVPIIALEKQKGITDLVNLWNKQKQISEEIIRQKEVLYNTYINEIIEEE